MSLFLFLTSTLYEEGIVIKLSNVALTLDPMVLIKEPSSLEQEPFK